MSSVTDTFFLKHKSHKIKHQNIELNLTGDLKIMLLMQ